jgi:hypothetical protein
MAKLIGRTINKTDVAIVSEEITLNTSTPIKIADANENRMFFEFCNHSAVSDVYLRLKPAGDTSGMGTLVQKKEPWRMPPDNIYTGEISAIAIIDSPTVCYTEY